MEFLIGTLSAACNVPTMAGDFNSPRGPVSIERIDELAISTVDIGMNLADDLRGGFPRARYVLCV
jgi:hypothetical protein